MCTKYLTEQQSLDSQWTEENSLNQQQDDLTKVIATNKSHRYFYK